MFNALSDFQKSMLDELVNHPDAAIEAIGIMGMLGDFEPIKYVVNAHKSKFAADIQQDMDLLMQQIAQVELAEAMAERETAVIN